MKENCLNSTAKEILIEYLEKNGLRKTTERFIVLDEIYNYDGHFEIEKLYLSMKNKNIDVSRATLYNTIDVLLAAKLVIQHQFGGNVKHYEKALRNVDHDHLICVNCGKVMEFTDRKIKDLCVGIAKNNNFTPSHHMFYIYGTCAQCEKETRK
ncbi:MAG: transcriptional repressor [Bacteroidales bacterium]|nr:transcriptional repressor [Bacteroidales bacterium]